MLVQIHAVLILLNAQRVLHFTNGGGGGGGGLKAKSVVNKPPPKYF